MKKRPFIAIKSYMKGFPFFVILCLFDGILNLGGQFCSIWGSKLLGDIAEGEDKMEIMIVMILVYVTLWQCVMFCVNIVRRRMIWKTEKEMKRGLLSRIIYGDYYNAGIESYTSELKMASSFFNEYFRYSILGVISIAGSVVMAATMSLSLLGCAAALGGALIIINMLLSKKIAGNTNDLWDGYRRINKKIGRMLRVTEVIGTFPNQSLFVRDFGDINESMKDQRNKTMFAYARLDAYFPVLIFLFQLLFLLIGLGFIQRGWSTLGIVMGSLQAASIIMGNLNYLGSIFTINQDKKTAIERYMQRMDNQTQQQYIRYQEQEPLIILDNVTVKTTDGDTLFEKMNYRVNEGDFIQINGENGKGKTTLLNSMLGFYIPESGVISWKSNSEESFDLFLNKKICYVPQTVFYLQDHSLIDNITGNSECIDIKKAQNIIDRLGMRELAEREALGTLSGGEAKKVLLAKAMYKEGEVWILDEPFAFLDSNTQKVMKTIILEEHKKGKTIIMISHKESTELGASIWNLW